MIAVGNLQQDILQVCGTKPVLLTNISSKHCVIVGTYSTPFVKKLIAANKIDKKELEGKMRNISCKLSPIPVKE